MKYLKFFENLDFDDISEEEYNNNYIFDELLNEIELLKKDIVSKVIVKINYNNLIKLREEIFNNSKQTEYLLKEINGYNYIYIYMGSDFIKNGCVSFMVEEYIDVDKYNKRNYPGIKIIDLT